MSELSRLQKILDYIDALIKDNDRILLEGTVHAGDDPAVGWANYRAGVIRRRDLLKVREETARICTALYPEEDGDTLQEMPEGKPERKKVNG